MKKLAGLLGIAIAVTLISPVQSFAAAPKAGATCTKVGSTSIASGKTFTCVKSGKKMVWDKGVAVATAASGSNSNAEQINFFVAIDQKTVHHLIANEGCANPSKSTAEVQVSVGNKWIAIKPIKSGWATSPACPVAQLGNKDSLAWVDAYLDPGVSYRWYFKGEVNIEHRDNLGNGYSASQTLPAPTPVQSAAPTPKTSATPTPKAPAKPTAADLPIPITLPVAQTGSITFANAVANYAQIPQTAWQRTQDIIAANPDVNVPTTIHIGPNTKASLNAINTGLNRINKLFAGFRHVSNYYGIVYNAQDVQWAQADAFDLFSKVGSKSYAAGKGQIKQASEAGCEINGSTVVNCGGGMAIEFGDVREEAAGAYYGVQSDGDYWTDATKFQGPMTQVNHEAMHTYQSTQFIYTPFGKNQNILADLMHDATPWWFSEGQANGIGIPTFVDNLPDYLRIRNDTVTRNPGSRSTIPASTEAGMKAFLNGQEIAGPQNMNWMLAYSVGFATVEALIAIGGPQSTLALYTLAAKGEDWQTAFKHVYGISWDEGSTVLAKVLAAEYSARPMSR